MVGARATSSTHKRRARAQHGLQKGNRPFRFFKIVLPAILLRNSLRIPDKFANTYGPQLSTTGAVLTIPTGLSWVVDLSRRDGKLHFTGQRWVKFMEHNDIRYGYLLEFEYHGNSHFTVHIMDLSCTEIDYPVEFGHDGNGNGNDNEQEAMRKIHSPFFTITVRTYHVAIAANAYLHIPSNFTKGYMERKRYKFIKLVVDDGREWDLHCYYSASGIRFRGPRWIKFKEENNWKKGEVYTFTLVNEKPKLLVFKVSKQ